MDDFRDISIDVLRQYFTGQLHKHRMNVENYLQKSVGVGEHSDIMETVEKRLKKLAKDNRRMIEKMHKEQRRLRREGKFPQVIKDIKR